MAGFCLLTGQSPATYRQLNQLERQAFIDVATRRR